MIKNLAYFRPLPIDTFCFVFYIICIEGLDSGLQNYYTHHLQGQIIDFIFPITYFVHNLSFNMSFV